MHNHMPNFTSLVDEIGADAVDKTGDFLDALKKNGGVGSLDLSKQIDQGISALGQNSVIDGVQGLGVVAHLFGKNNPTMNNNEIP